VSARPADRPPARDTLLKALQASGMALRPAPDGSLHASADRVELRNVGLQTLLGAADVVKVTLIGAALRLRVANATFDLLGLSADEVQVEDAELRASPAAAALASVRVEPLSTVQGRLQASIRDAAWVIDAEILVPVVAGRVDFDRVVVEHVGPNSAIGVAREGVYVEAPHGDRIALVGFARPDIPGVRYEQRGGFAGLRTTDRGSIDVRPFAEAALRAGMADPPWRMPAANVRAMLDRAKLTGDLQLADGMLGSAHDHLVLDGRAEGRNGIALTAAVLGQRLVVRWPDLCASKAQFGMLGRSGVAGAIDASVEMQVTGLSGDAPEVAVKVHRMTVRHVVLD
jgi:hypothetical protein